MTGNRNAKTFWYQSSSCFWLGESHTHIFLQRNLCWNGQIAKKLSILKSQGLRNFFFHCQYHNFENTVTNFDKDMFRKIFLWYRLLQLNEDHIKKCRYLFLTPQNRVFFCLLFYFKENV